MLINAYNHDLQNPILSKMPHNYGRKKCSDAQNETCAISSYRPAHCFRSERSMGYARNHDSISSSVGDRDLASSCITFKL